MSRLKELLYLYLLESKSDVAIKKDPPKKINSRLLIYNNNVEFAQFENTIIVLVGEKTWGGENGARRKCRS